MQYIGPSVTLPSPWTRRIWTKLVYTVHHHRAYRKTEKPMAASITLFDRQNPPATLAEVSVLYTDLDGSLLAPGGTVMTSHDGTPSTEALECLMALREAGVEVVIVTGRNRSQCA
jgi:phosphoglycolate phosphatase-like HAD superfamily hydrolase